MNTAESSMGGSFTRGWRNAVVVAVIVFREALRKQEGAAIAFIAGVVLCSLVVMPDGGRPEMTRVVADLCLAMIWVVTTAMGLTLAARQLPDGLRKRTLPLLLSKPISRSEYLRGLTIGCGLANAAALAVCYPALAVGFLASGVGDWIGLLQALVLHWGALSLFSGMALTLAVWRSPTGLNVCICLLIGSLMLLGARPLHDAVCALSSSIPGGPLEALYYLLPHFELLDARALAVGSRPAAPAGAVLATVAYAMCACAALLKVAEWRLNLHPLLSE